MSRLVLVVVLTTFALPAQATLSLELGFGGAWNAPTTLTIEQTGQPDIKQESADYSTRPFDAPPYYRVRAGWSFGAHGIRLEFVHHKLYLEDLPTGVQHFEVTHGYNFLFVSFVHEWTLLPGFLSLSSNAGLGPVLAHTESTVRGLDFQPETSLPGNQELAGGALQVGGGIKLTTLPFLTLALETAVTAGWANVSVANGEARAPNIAVHLFAVVGVEFL